MKGQIATGYTVGNGAAINIPIGFYPDLVIVTNLTDGDLMTIGHLGKTPLAFTSGGVSEIGIGDKITGNTSGSTAIVDHVLLSSGTWAAGTAAGFLVVSEQTGTFATETVILDGGTDDASVTAAITPNVAIAAAVAAATTTSALSRYTGSAGTAARGFTIGSVVAEEAKLLHWTALRGDAYLGVAA